MARIATNEKVSIQKAPTMKAVVDRNGCVDRWTCDGCVAGGLEFKFCRKGGAPAQARHSSAAIPRIAQIKVTIPRAPQKASGPACVTRHSVCSGLSCSSLGSLLGSNSPFGRLIFSFSTNLSQIVLQLASTIDIIFAPTVHGCAGTNRFQSTLLPRGEL